MKRTTFFVPKMDCPSEEQMIRQTLSDESSIKGLFFDLQSRQVEIYHSMDDSTLLTRMERLGLGAQHRDTEIADSEEVEKRLNSSGSTQARDLWILLSLNFLMFLVEVGAGVYSQSMGLIADGLDMLADAAVYGISLYAVGRLARTKAKTALVSGFAQLFLALIALYELTERVFVGSHPVSGYMMGFSLLALAVNAGCLLLISRHRHGDVHMKASWIFSANDVVANVGVIIAGALVWWLDRSWPDLLIGAIIAMIVIRGAFKIIQLSLEELRNRTP